MQSETGFPSSHQLKSYVASKSRLKLAARAVLSADAGLLVFTCKPHHACLLFVSVHQMAPPLTEVADIRLQLTTHLSTPKGRKAELACLVDL